MTFWYFIFLNNILLIIIIHFIHIRTYSNVYYFLLTFHTIFRSRRYLKACVVSCRGVSCHVYLLYMYASSVGAEHMTHLLDIFELAAALITITEF